VIPPKKDTSVGTRDNGVLESLGWVTVFVYVMSSAIGYKRLDCLLLLFILV
jgi:hypothetical protein